MSEGPSEDRQVGEALIYDITPAITSRLKVWPGDSPPTREVLLDIARGDNITLSTLRATVHLGAHVDAPSHYAGAGHDISGVPLEVCVGPCQVVRADMQPGERVRWGDLAQEPESERVLIATGSYPDPELFNEDFSGLAPELIDQLAARGVKLVGIDTPSVDLFQSQDLPAHAACARHGIYILEGIVLEDIRPGRYELMALPLKLDGFDASPVRAVLRG